MSIATSKTLHLASLLLIDPPSLEKNSSNKEELSESPFPYEAEFGGGLTVMEASGTPIVPDTSGPVYPIDQLGGIQQLGGANFNQF